MSKRNTKTVTYERSLGDPLSAQAMQDLRAIASLRDRSLDYSDIPPLPQGWSKRAKAGAKSFDQIFKTRKEAISLRLDADVLLWLRAGGEGYQSRINSILRDRMNSEVKTLG